VKSGDGAKPGSPVQNGEEYPPLLGVVRLCGTRPSIVSQLSLGPRPYIPVIDRRHQTHRHFTRDQFQYDQVKNVFRCPQGQTLRYRGMDRQAQGYLYQTAESQCQGCPVKKRCTGGSTRRLFVHWHEPARQTARELAQTAAYACSQRERDKIEVLFSELKLRVGLRRVRLRRLWNVSEQFYLRPQPRILSGWFGSWHNESPCQFHVPPN
jgi:Transposase DDE domain